MRDNYWPTWAEVKRCEDHIVDEVAIERALQGDATVLDAMTALERWELIERLAEWAGTPKWWVEGVRTPGREGGHWSSPPLQVIWPLYQLCLTWDVDYQATMDKVQSRVQVRQRRAKRASAA